MSALLVVSGCGTSSEKGEAVSASPSPSGPVVSSVPVPPGVQKDSVLDLNSTKDMTGVVTTVSIGDSPYDENMPDICGFIPQSAMNQIGMEFKKKAFYGPKLVTQSCLLDPPVAADNAFGASVEFYVNNIKELISKPDSVVVSRDVPIVPEVSGFIQVDANLESTNDKTTCFLVWGTFYGSSGIRFDNYNGRNDACDRAKTLATTLQPLLPRSPSQMRPTS